MKNDLFRGKYQLFTPRQARFFRRLQIFTEALASFTSYVAMDGADRLQLGHLQSLCEQTIASYYRSQI